MTAAVDTPRSASAACTVLVDDWILTRPPTGIRQYLECLAAHWPTGSSARLVGPRLSRRAAVRTAPGGVTSLTLRSLPELLAAPTPRRPFESLLRRGQQAILAAQLARARRRADVLFEPNGLVPCDLRPAVATLHDLSVLELPSCHPPSRVEHWRRHAPQAVTWTDRFVCVSGATAVAATRVLGIARERLEVIHLASRWAVGRTSTSPPWIDAPPRLPARYLVSVGTIEPRKNHLRLLDAWSTLDAATRRGAGLVFAGGVGWGDEAFRRSLAEHPVASEVRCTGSIDDAALEALVRGAAGMLYPSLYEGFGLPPLEAMSVGVPVAASSADSVREVVGEAAIVLPPDDTDGWANAMRLLLEPGAERDRRSAAGLERAARFSWHHCAERHAAVFAATASAAGATA